VKIYRKKRAATVAILTVGESGKKRRKRKYFKQRRKLELRGDFRGH